MSDAADSPRRGVVIVALFLFVGMVLIASTDETADGSKAPTSAATRRANRWPDTAAWYGEFSIKDLHGDLAYDEQTIRRDPSAVLQIGDLYHVWYTKGSNQSAESVEGGTEAKLYPWDLTEIWWATSADGWDWEEQGLAVGRGHAGTHDDRAVFTPEVLSYDGRYYLVYQTVQAPYRIRTKNTVSMAIADSPKGPWVKLPEPILRPADDGEWLGEEDDRQSVVTRGSFDSHKVHDPCLLPYDGKFYLYYKGEQMGEQVTLGGRDIRWGVAIADQATGPYRKSSLNPITNSGHEVCVWPYQGGVAALLTTDGPERNTIQHAQDGLDFEIMSSLKRTPVALGLVRSLDPESHPLAALEWGLCHEYRGGSQHLRRFACKRLERDVPEDGQ